ncbi:putative arabinose efflux permease, MFS family [Promicromonospora umidemergens]|uniref:MFS transporter n=1 Tax=Promicromonospora umidemergens TaxID=629679 RepID=A0ABP8X6L6_9MICO|nr:MFS transporter [Promicromonospora umidemergens]MCP2281408.1 putative arabinose efflux permease, MFS family [Promicromonospora umidemergens]
MSTTPTDHDLPILRVPGVRALLWTSVFGFAGYALLLPTAPLWAIRGGADEGGAGLVNAVLMLATVAVQTTVPWSLRRLGWRTTLSIGVLLLGLPSFALMLTDQLAGILAVSAVRGAGFAILTVCGASAVASLVDATRRGRAIGVYGLAVAAPQLFLVPSAAWIAESIDFRVVFVLGAAPALAVPFAAALGRRLDDIAEAGVPDTGDEARPGRGRMLLALALPSLVLLAVTTPGGALLTFAPQFRHGSTVAVLGLLGFTAAAALSRWLVGGPADRFGPSRFISPLLALCAGGLALCAWSLTETGPGPAVLAAGMTVVGVAYGSLQNLTLVTAFAAVPDRDRSLASAVWNIGFDTGTGLGSLVVGFIAAGTSFSVGLLTTAALCVVIAVVALVGGGSAGRVVGRTSGDR